MISNVDARMTFDVAKQVFANAFGAEMLPKLKLTQHTLRLETALTAGQNTFQFNVLANQTLNFNTEVRLDLQDTFLLNQLLFYIALPSSATDTNFVPKTYPSPTLFTNVNNSVYNGSLELLANKDTIISNWDLWRHYYAPQTQETTAVDTPIDEFDGGSYGFYPVEPNIMFVGSRSYILTVTLAEALAATDANARIGLMMRGILAQNSTPVR